MKLCFEVIIEEDAGRFHAYCTALKGLHTDGDTVAEAIENARDAIAAYIESLRKANEALPVGVVVKKEFAFLEWLRGLVAKHRPVRTANVMIPA